MITMAEEDSRVFIDDLNNIRLANPDVLEASSVLKCECEQFIGQLDSFNNFVHSVRASLEEVGKVADYERLKLMAAQNELKKSQDDASEEQQQMQILIRERMVELDRLKTELRSLKSVEAQQQDYLQRIRSNTL